MSNLIQRLFPRFEVTGMGWRQGCQIALFLNQKS
jgi:hypothetical protein